MGIFDFILQKIDIPITISVSPEQFIVTCGDSTKMYETVVFISTDEKLKDRLLGTGQAFIPATPHFRIELFGANNLIDASISKEYCLEILMKHIVITQYLPQVRFPTPRPKVIFIDVDQLNNCLSGYQKSILRVAAENAGARECQFIP